MHSSSIRKSSSLKSPTATANQEAYQHFDSQFVNLQTAQPRRHSENQKHKRKLSLKAEENNELIDIRKRTIKLNQNPVIPAQTAKKKSMSRLKKAKAAEIKR